ncbi:MAG: glycine zipper family protein [Patescibacteria group bacterium]
MSEATLLAEPITPDVSVSTPNPVKNNRQKREQKRAEAEKPKPGEIRLPISEFIPGASPRLSTKEGKRTRPIEAGKLKTEAIFSKTVIDGSAEFLLEHLKQLQRIDSRLLDPENHSHEIAMLDEMADEKGNISESKVREFVKTSDGLKMVQQISDIRTRYETFSMAADIVAAWGVTEQGPIDTRLTISLDRLAREFHGRLGSFKSGVRFPERLAGVGGAIIGATTGAITGASLVELSSHLNGMVDFFKGINRVGGGALWGALVGGVGGRELGRRFLSSSGDIDVRACTDGITAIRALPDSERAYIRAVSGINFEDFDVNADNQIIWTAMPADRRTNDIDTITEEIRGRLQLRQEFYNAIGLKRPDTRSVPFQLLGRNVEAIPQTNTIWLDRVKEIYDDLIPGPAAPPLGPAEELNLYIQAQQQALNEYMEDFMFKVKDKGLHRRKGAYIDFRESISQLEATKVRLENNNNEEKSILQARVDALIGNESEGSETKGGDYKTVKAESSVFTEREDLQRSIDEETQEIILKNSKGVDATGVRTLDELIQKHLDILSTDPVSLGFIARKEQDIFGRTNTALTNVDNSSRSAGEQKNAIYANQKIELDALTTLRNQIEIQLQTIKEKKFEFDKKIKNIDEFDTSKTRDIVDRLKIDRVFILSLGLTDYQLSTLSISELNALINNVNQADIDQGVGDPRGWGENENLDVSRRNVLLHAIVESRTRHRMYETSLILSSGISVTDLRDRSVDEINRIANANFASGGSGWSPIQNEDMVSYIQRSKTTLDKSDYARADIYRTFLGDIEIEAQQIKDRIKRIDNGDLVRELDAANVLMSDPGSLYTRTIAALRNVGSRTGLFDTSTIPLGGEYDYTTEQEREFSAGARTPRPRAYYEFLNLIFQYQSQENPGQAFYTGTLLLEPNALARIFRNNPRLQLAGVRADFNTVIRGLEERFNDGRINERDIRLAMVDVIAHVKGQALSN